MSFKMVKGGKWEDQYNFVYLPNSINPVEAKKKLRQEQSLVSGQKDFP
jgi:hypothetical protein